ncbi:MAG: hypothetical protein EOO24_02110 [Comamonadaceae bacterium]|nr:MAG: hypothetical protein EOO24_02110 [Comamonadaceae bacterium]
MKPCPSTDASHRPAAGATVAAKPFAAAPAVLPMRRRIEPGRSQRGIVTVEYVIGALFVSLLLFVGNPSPIERLLETLRANHSARAYAIGSPLIGSALKP